MAYRARRRADFDFAAAEHGGRVLEVLLSALKPERRAELEAHLVTYPLEARATYHGWLHSETGGPDAGLVLLEAARAHLAALSARATNYEQYPAHNVLSDYAAAFSARAEMPWLFLELRGGLRAGHDFVATSAEYLVREIGERGYPAIRHAVQSRPKWIWSLARHLALNDAYDVELGFETLDDPGLRELAERAVSKNAAGHVERLRTLVETATGETRAFALQTLRQFDKDLTPDGRVASSPMEKVEAELRRTPDDAAASQVWADALIEQDDPRGQYAALEHAIRTAAPAAALAFSEEQAKLLAARRSELVGKPGGFPFRDPWLGRKQLSVRSAERFHIPGLKHPVTYDRAQAFIQRLTDVRGPAQVHFEDARHALYRNEKDNPTEPATEGEATLLRLLAPATMYGSLARGNYIVRDDPRAPLADEAELRKAILAESAITLVYLFAHAHMDTGIALPYQEHARSRFQLMPRMKEETLFSLAFPFEEFDDPAFGARFQAIAEALGSLPLPALSFTQLATDAEGRHQFGVAWKPPKGFGKVTKQ